MSKTAWEVVQLARDPKRPTSQYFIDNIFTDFLEIHGDKFFGDDSAVICGVGMLDDMPVTIIGQEKGTDITSKSMRNFGCAHPEGYRKSLRLVKQAEKFNRPVIFFVDTQGAYCGIGAEERGMGEALARNLEELSRVKVPVISILIGEGGSGGALAFAVCDKMAMLENSVYSILSPEGFSSILWKDNSRAKEAAQLMKMTAYEVKEMGIIDDVIKEPLTANTQDEGEFAAVVKSYIVENLNALLNQSTEELLNKRSEKIRNFGKEYISY